MKLLPVAAKLFRVDERTDGWTDMTRLIFGLAMLQTSLIIVTADSYPVPVPQLKLVFQECSTKDTEPHTTID